MRIYISGPITGMPEGNKPAFMRAEDLLLISRNCQVANPYVKDVPEDAPWLEHMRADIKMLMDCQGICLLPGWQRSKGANIEIRLAIDLGLEVRTLEEWLQ